MQSVLPRVGRHSHDPSRGAAGRGPLVLGPLPLLVILEAVAIATLLRLLVAALLPKTYPAAGPVVAESVGTPVLVVLLAVLS